VEEFCLRTEVCTAVASSGFYNLLQFFVISVDSTCCPRRTNPELFPKTPSRVHNVSHVRIQHLVKQTQKFLRPAVWKTLWHTTVHALQLVILHCYSEGHGCPGTWYVLWCGNWTTLSHAHFSMCRELPLTYKYLPAKHSVELALIIVSRPKVLRHNGCLMPETLANLKRCRVRRLGASGGFWDRSWAERKKRGTDRQTANFSLEYSWWNSSEQKSVVSLITWPDVTVERAALLLRVGDVPSLYCPYWYALWCVQLPCETSDEANIRLSISLLWHEASLGESCIHHIDQRFPNFFGPPPPLGSINTPTAPPSVP
jgi:hypothetical protein